MGITQPLKWKNKVSRKTFFKFYRRYYDLISKFQIGLKSLLRQGLSFRNLNSIVTRCKYKVKKIVGSNNFSAQFIEIISHYKKDWLTLMHCSRLHAWWSTQSRLATLLSSLIALRWIGLQTLRRFRLKYTIHNKFSSFLCFASFCAHLCAISNHFNWNDENSILGKWKNEFSDAIL